MFQIKRRKLVAAELRSHSEWTIDHWLPRSVMVSGREFPGMAGYFDEILLSRNVRKYMNRNGSLYGKFGDVVST